MKDLIKKIIPDDVFRSLLVALKSALRGRSSRFFRGEAKVVRRPVLKEDGRLCIGCGLCEKVCPSSALWVETSKRDGKWVLERLSIDPSRCVSCGLCIESCPSEVLAALFEQAKPTLSKPVRIYLKQSEEA